MRREKRTDINFSNHEHRVEYFKSENGDSLISVDHFQVGDSMASYIKFTNTAHNLVVTGDYGNWVFCRPFIPGVNNYVSDGYWLEKLSTYSNQVYSDYDSDETANEIMILVQTGLEEYGYEGDELKASKEWFSSLLYFVDDELEYTYHAYRGDKPSFIGYDEVPLVKKVDSRLLIIFDAYDEICNRLENKMVK